MKEKQYQLYIHLATANWLTHIIVYSVLSYAVLFFFSSLLSYKTALCILGSVLPKYQQSSIDYIHILWLEHCPAFDKSLSEGEELTKRWSSCEIVAEVVYEMAYLELYTKYCQRAPSAWAHPMTKCVSNPHVHKNRLVHATRTREQWEQMAANPHTGEPTAVWDWSQQSPV